MQCKSCGSTLADGQRFCPTCGAAAPPPADPACANCGATLEVGARFCPACGRAVDDAPDATPEVPAVACCASCGAELAPEARFCRACGAPVGAATPVQAQPVAAVPQATWAPPPGAFAAPPPATGAGHPVALNIPYSASLSRWKIFFKSFLIIPNVVVLYFVLIGFSITTFLAWWAILFTGRYPRGLFSFGEATMRRMMNIEAYMLLLRDEYPPFTGAPGMYPVEFSIHYPERLSRLLMLFKWLTIIPSAFVFGFVALIGYIGVFIAWWAILITGHMPRGIHSFLTGLLRWGARISAYTYLLTDAYPGFSMS